MSSSTLPPPVFLNYDEDELSFLEEMEDEDDFGDDPCHEMEHSVFFFIILFMSFGLVVAYFVLLAKRYSI